MNWHYLICQSKAICKCCFKDELRSPRRFVSWPVLYSWTQQHHKNDDNFSFSELGKHRRICLFLVWWPFFAFKAVSNPLNNSPPVVLFVAMVYHLTASPFGIFHKFSLSIEMIVTVLGFRFRKFQFFDVILLCPLFLFWVDIFLKNPRYQNVLVIALLIPSSRLLLFKCPTIY